MTMGEEPVRAPPAPRPRGAARGAGGGSERSGEECERAGRAGPGRQGQSGGRQGRRARRGRARRMPHFTVVPVDGPRRGDYDNLEGLSWVDYGERADRENSEGEDAPGGVLGGGGGREAGHAGPALTPTPADSIFLGPRRPRLRSGLPPRPSSSLAGRGRGLQTWPGLPGQPGRPGRGER
ncbi:hypothetical protein J1605_014076 [Eschrichtius robustus]|uniref:Uncharacterized protein n=1 Tax=Eschrichtius robustus TaxID=9764 RepID=A0AB34GDE6_ESCRO|nr:hypothetical protein J1605_014076 [Eschrichtius robustus]